jgi:hypothetical protein
MTPDPLKVRRGRVSVKNLPRRKRIARASAQPLRLDPVNRLAQRLYPKRQQLLLTEVRYETKTTRMFRLVPDPDSDTRNWHIFGWAWLLLPKVALENAASVTHSLFLERCTFILIAMAGGLQTKSLAIFIPVPLILSRTLKFLFREAHKEVVSRRWPSLC